LIVLAIKPVIPAKAGISWRETETPTPPSHRPDLTSIAPYDSFRDGGRVKGGWVYIMTNKPRGVLYVGATADIVVRVGQHRSGRGSAFCRKYNLTRLVLAEPYPTIRDAKAREKEMKEWRRGWKIERIEEDNPDWVDLWEGIGD
jgi:putative endonuclease